MTNQSLDYLFITKRIKCRVLKVCVGARQKENSKGSIPNKDEKTGRKNEGGTLEEDSVRARRCKCTYEECGDTRNELKEEYIACGNFQSGRNGFLRYYKRVRLWRLLMSKLSMQGVEIGQECLTVFAKIV